MGLTPGAYWPFLTSMFLHGSGLHLLGNMWTLWIFGDNVEDRMGPGRFVVFYLSCGLIAGIVHVMTNPDSTLPTIGASGAIAGVMGAYFLLFPRAGIVVMFPLLFIPLFFELPAMTYLAWWALSQVLSGTLSLAAAESIGGIAWWAHVGGFIAGIFLQFFFVKRGRDYRALSRDQYGMDVAWTPAGQWRRH
jgi:membrane associated rhomboid family serine protease